MVFVASHRQGTGDMKTDAELYCDVQAELAWDPRFDHRALSIQVKEGVVTLTGAVSRYADRYLAAEVAGNVPGVRAVANDVGIKIACQDASQDTELALAVANALCQGLPASSGIKAIVNKGWVTLTGQADRESHKLAADRVVRGLAGVVGVVNSITLASMTEPAEDIH
jgi:osmotically-inducible protein OsmY